MVFALRPLTAGDADAVRALLERSPAYPRRVSGREVAAGDGREILDALPPGVARGAKSVIGLFGDDGTLRGICDVIRHWPQRGTAHIGLLLVDAGQTGRGLGRLLHDSVVAQLRAEGGLARLRAGLVDTNAEAAGAFWHRLGYRPTGESRPYADGEVVSRAAILERELVPAPMQGAVAARPAGLHHLELWTADLARSEPEWDWLLTELGWRAERVEGWSTGRIWRHRDGSYLVLEQSPDVAGEGANRCAPGMNHVALTGGDRSALDRLRGRAAAHGWSELFPAAYPHAGGPDHLAWYGEDSQGIEVEVVARTANDARAIF